MGRVRKRDEGSVTMKGVARGDSVRVRVRVFSSLGRGGNLTPLKMVPPFELNSPLLNLFSVLHA